MERGLDVLDSEAAVLRDSIRACYIMLNTGTPKPLVSSCPSVELAQSSASTVSVNGGRESCEAQDEPDA